jgi:hypothetical protein
VFIHDVAQQLALCCRLAVDGGAKSAARLDHTYGIKGANTVDEIGLWYDPQIVEAGRAV